MDHGTSYLQSNDTIHTRLGSVTELILDSYWNSDPEMSEIVRSCIGLESLYIRVEPESVVFFTNLS